MKRSRGLFLNDVKSSSNVGQSINHLKKLKVFINGKYSTNDGMPTITFKPHMVKKLDSDVFEDQTLAKVITAISMYTDADYNVAINEYAAYFTINATKDIFILQNNADKKYELLQPDQDSALYTKLFTKVFHCKFVKFDVDSMDSQKPAPPIDGLTIIDAVLNFLEDNLHNDETKGIIIKTIHDDLSDLVSKFIDAVNIGDSEFTRVSQEVLHKFIEETVTRRMGKMTDKVYDAYTVMFKYVTDMTTDMMSSDVPEISDISQAPEDGILDGGNTEKT